MHERRALHRAAWRELWPAALLVVGCAIALAWSSAVGIRPAAMWIGLWLVPAALLGGTAVGRGTPRMLAFLLARPVRRERVLLSRIAVALASLAAAWAIVVAAVLVRDPHVATGIDAIIVGAALVLALLCGALGSTATDREPLALGIGTLVFSSMACIPLVGTEALDITFARTIASGSSFVVLALAIGIVGIGRAVLRVWREGLPLRDARTIRALVIDCAGAWAIAEAIVVVQIWRSASPAASVPMIVLGVDERGVVVASGSPQSLDGSERARIDAVHVGMDDPLVAFHVGRRGLFEGASHVAVVTRALAENGRLAVEVTSLGAAPACHVVIVDDAGDARVLDVECGRLSFSPSARSLAIASKTELAVVDPSSGEVRTRIETPRERDVLGWSGEDPVSWERRGASAGRSDDVFVGEAKAADVDAMRAVLSPDGHRLAYVAMKASLRFGREAVGRSGRIEILALAGGEKRVLVEERRGAEVIGWIDAEHLATVGYTHEDQVSAISILAVTSGEVVSSFARSRSLPITTIDGPPRGPWLVTRAGILVEAWSSAGADLWSEPVASFERDEPNARRWAISDGIVVGIDPRGRSWSHQVPWETTP